MLIAGRLASLRARMMALSLAALAPGFAVSFYVAYDVTRLRQAEIADLALRSARQAAYEVDRILAGIEALLIGISAAPATSGPACGDYLAELRIRLPHLAALAVVAADGSVACGAGPLSMPVARLADVLAAGNAGTALAIGEYIAAGDARPAVLPVALALRDRAGLPVGSVVALVDLDWLGRQLQARSLPAGGSLTVADRTGTILARHPAPERFVGTRIPPDFLRLVDAGSAGTETLLSQDGTRRVLGYVPVGELPYGLYVSTGLSAQASYAAVGQAVRIGLLLAALGGLATLVATWLVGSRVFVRPLLRLKSVLERWRAGERGLRSGARAEGGEIAAVGLAMDRLMEEIARGEERRALLSRELAHRVANTLAIVQSMALATLNKPGPAREMLPAFLARLSALARTHHVLVQESWEAADLRALVLQVVQPLADEAERRFVLDGPPVRLEPSHALAMTMVLHELCTNALKYGALSGPAGQVTLRWTLAGPPDAPELRLDWRESGGPEVSAGGRTGFGTRLVGRAFAGMGEARLDFDRAGLACHIRLRLHEADLAA